MPSFNVNRGNNVGKCHRLTRSYKNSTLIFVTLMAALYLLCPQEQCLISEAWWEIQIKASLSTLLISMNVSSFTFWWHGHSAYSTLLCDCTQKRNRKGYRIYLAHASSFSSSFNVQTSSAQKWWHFLHCSCFVSSFPFIQFSWNTTVALHTNDSLILSTRLEPRGWDMNCSAS